MFTHVLVCVDHPEGGRDALALARQLVDRSGKVTVAHVYPDNPYVYGAVNAEFEGSEHDQGPDFPTHEREGIRVQPPHGSSRASSVGRRLNEDCQQLGADLLVVSASRRRASRTALHGDITSAALDSARCAVAIAPAGYSREDLGMREIGVCYDGSPDSQRGLRVARDLAAEHGARLSAFRAIYVPTFEYRIPIPDDAQAETMVQAARDGIADLGGVEAHAGYGKPVEQLTLYSSGLDLLVIGSRGYGPLRRLVRRSTARQLARTARCPLLVVTPRTAPPNGTADLGQPPVAAGIRRDDQPITRTARR
jgi:nucleotide-binding universal stress UspA family protein